MAVYPTSPVASVADTVKFYQDQLGFELQFLWGEPPTHGAVMLGDATVHFYSGDPTPGQSWMYFQVESVDDLFDWYRGNEVELLDQPETRPWGMREFNLKDLNGYYLRFGQSDLKSGSPVPVERVAVDVRLEKRLAQLLGDLAAHKQMTISETLEETLLHSFETLSGQEGRTVASPHTKRTMNFIEDLKQQHGLDYDTHDSYRFTEEPGETEEH